MRARERLRARPNCIDGSDELPARAEDRPEPSAVAYFEQLVRDVEVVREVRGVRFLVRGDGPGDPVVDSMVVLFSVRGASGIGTMKRLA